MGKGNETLAVLRAVEADRIRFTVGAHHEGSWQDIRGDHQDYLSPVMMAAHDSGWVALDGQRTHCGQVLLARLTDAGRRELDRLAAANPAAGHVMVPAEEYETLLHAASRAANRLASLDHDAAAELTGALAAIEEGAWRVC